ncbi:MAG TPA: ASPIC/UnbV domain-containing protein, partial [Thermoanaerobaculia bacterium]|nr:ASPIC/UnbV domain-containing protein [Thermoanaerobaculia bacterium]
YENLGGRFREVAGAGLDAVRVSRGLATGDFDGDGDRDLVIVASNGLAEVYENLGGSAAGGWLAVDLRGRGGNRFGIGARLELETPGREGSQVREVVTGSSYLSQSELAAHFGLGAAESATLTVRWPSGRVQRVRDLAADRRVVAYE